MAVRQEAALLYVSHKPPDWNVIQDKFKVVQLLNGLTQLVHLIHTKHTMDHIPSVLIKGTTFSTTNILSLYLIGIVEEIIEMSA